MGNACDPSRNVVSIQSNKRKTQKNKRGNIVTSQNNSASDYEALLPYATECQAQKVAALLEHGTQKKAADSLGINPRTLERALSTLKRNAAKRGYAPEYGLNSPIPEGHRIRRVSELTDAEGNVKATWKSYEPEAKQEEKSKLEEFAYTLIGSVKGKYKPKKYKGKIQEDNKLLTSIIIGDAHLGMLAHSKETGDEDYGLEDTVNDLKNAINYLVGSAPKSQVGVLVNLGDFTHANGIAPLTPASGHVLDVDKTFSDVIDSSADVIRFAVDRMLKKFPEVWIINQRGNHDPDAALWLNKLIEAYYEKEDRVLIFDNNYKFMNFTWGRNFVSTHHGDRMNFQRWYETLTRDYREEWGNSLFTFGWQGHIHHETKKEIGGAVFESFQTLVAPDKWHKSMGYGAGRSMTSLTLHKELGEVVRNKCSLNLLRSVDD